MVARTESECTATLESAYQRGAAKGDIAGAKDELKAEIGDFRADIANFKHELTAAFRIMQWLMVVAVSFAVDIIIILTYF